MIVENLRKNYIKKDNLDNFLHLQIPRKIWNMFLEKKISTPAFKIYVEFFERLKLSAKSNWVDENENVYIKYSYDEIMKKVLSNRSRGTVSTALTELKDLNLIIQKKGFRTSSRFYLSNVLDFKVQKSEKQTFKFQKSLKENLKVRKRELQKSDFLDSNNNYYININKITTTTKSSRNELILIKKYLFLNNVDSFTEKNILKICEENNLTLTRVKELFKYAVNNKKGYGYIVKALKNNWKLNKIEESKNILTEKAIKRMYNYSLEYQEFGYSRGEILNIFDEATKKHKGDEIVKKYRKKIETEEILWKK